MVAGTSFLITSDKIFAQQRDSVFSNSLFYNSIYDDGAFIDSNYIADLIYEIELSEGEKRVGLLFKLLNGYYFNNPQISRELGEEALKISLSISNDSLIAYSYHYTGLAYKYLGFKRISLELYSKGLATDFAKKTKNYRSWVTFNSGVNYFELGEPDSAAVYYYEAIRLNETVGNITFASKTYLELCRLFYSIGNYEESLKNYYESISRLDLKKEKRVAAKLFTERFKIEIKLQNLDSAKTYLNAALQKGIELNDSSLISSIYYEFGSQLFDDEIFDEALLNYELGISYVNKSLYKVEYFSFLHGIGKANLYLGNVTKARNQIFSAIDGLKDHPNKELLQQFELTLALLYSRTGDWDKFNFHFKKAEKYGLENVAEKELLAIDELKTIYETEKKDQKIEHQNYQISSQKKRIMLISGIAFVTLVGLFITLFLTKKLNFANKNLIEKNLELSERWKQLQKFYSSEESDSLTTTQNGLFHRIYQLMVKQKIYTKSDITVEYISKQLNSNTKYISKAIKEETEMNFNTFINTFRIEEAKKLLQDKVSSTWSLDAIAEQSGFNNTTSFFQAFKKNTGLTPSAFRKAFVTSLSGDLIF